MECSWNNLSTDLLQKSEGDAIEEKVTLDLNIVQLETPEMDFEMVFAHSL